MIFVNLFKLFLSKVIIAKEICLCYTADVILCGYLLLAYLLDIILIFILVSFIVKFFTKRTIFYWIEKIM